MASAHQGQPSAGVAATAADTDTFPADKSSNHNRHRHKPTRLHSFNPAMSQQSHFLHSEFSLKDLSQYRCSSEGSALSARAVFE
jgi:hypothetical protein